MAILRSRVFKPGPIKAHEIAKALGVGIPGVLDEGGEAGRQYLRQALLAGVVERARQQQRAGIVIDAIAVRTIRHAMNGVLKQAGIVAHRQEVIDLHFRRSMTVAQQTCWCPIGQSS